MGTFDDRPRENCGVAAVYRPAGPAAPFVYELLLQLNHRGQESWGIASWDSGFRLEKEMQPVDTVLKSMLARYLANLPGQWAIGHNRYSTAASSDLPHAQPFVYERFAIAHNGTIRNAGELGRELKKEGETFETQSDTEVAARLIARGKDVVEGVTLAARELRGSWCFAILTKDGIYAARDPRGFKPLAIGRGDGVVGVASESSAFNPHLNGMEFEREVAAGEIYHCGADGEWSVQLPRQPAATDIFELYYFARPDSVIDGISVSGFRRGIGERIASRDRFENDRRTIISRVPYSGTDYAFGAAAASGLPMADALYRHRHIGRSFIAPEQRERRSAVLRKFSPIRKNVEGRRVVLYDDSLIRGTTARELLEMLRDAKAEEVHFRAGLPPVSGACHFGIDMKAPEEHIFVQQGSIKAVQKAIGADSLAYGTLEDAAAVTGRPGSSFCTFCLDLKDPERRF